MRSYFQKREIDFNVLKHKQCKLLVSFHLPCTLKISNHFVLISNIKASTEGNELFSPAITANFLHFNLSFLVLSPTFSFFSNFTLHRHHSLF